MHCIVRSSVAGVSTFCNTRCEGEDPLLFVDRISHCGFHVQYSLPLDPKAAVRSNLLFPSYGHHTYSAPFPPHQKRFLYIFGFTSSNSALSFSISVACIGQPMPSPSASLGLGICENWPSVHQRIFSPPNSLSLLRLSIRFPASVTKILGKFRSWKPLTGIGFGSEAGVAGREFVREREGGAAREGGG